MKNLVVSILTFIVTVSPPLFSAEIQVVVDEDPFLSEWIESESVFRFSFLSGLGSNWEMQGLLGLQWPMLFSSHAMGLFQNEFSGQNMFEDGDPGQNPWNQNFGEEEGGLGTGEYENASLPSEENPDEITVGGAGEFAQIRKILEAGKKPRLDFKGDLLKNLGNRNGFLDNRQMYFSRSSVSLNSTKQASSLTNLSGSRTNEKKLIGGRSDVQVKDDSRTVQHAISHQGHGGTTLSDGNNKHQLID